MPRRLKNISGTTSQTCNQLQVVLLDTANVLGEINTINNIGGGLIESPKSYQRIANKVLKSSDAMTTKGNSDKRTKEQNMWYQKQTILYQGEMRTVLGGKNTLRPF